MKDYNRSNIPLAKELRKNMTKWERKLWYEFLRDYPIRFQRQKAHKRFARNGFADFTNCEYCGRERFQNGM